jgi:hypothetical protein
MKAEEKTVFKERIEYSLHFLPRNPEIQKSRNPEIQNSRNPEIQKSRNPEIQKSRNHGIAELLNLRI